MGYTEFDDEKKVSIRVKNGVCEIKVYKDGRERVYLDSITIYIKSK